MDEADRERLGGVDLAAGDDRFQRAAEPDHGRQPLRAAVDQRYATTPLEAAGASVVGGDPQVAPERQLEPPGDTRAPSSAEKRS